MADDTPPPQTLAPPAVTALKQEASKDGQDRGQMLRTISMDIREEREDLKRAAEQCMNAIIELDLEGRVRWVSPSWHDVTGMAAEDLKGKTMADVVVDSRDVFTRCVEAMRTDDSKSRIVRFAIRCPSGRVAGDQDTDDGDETPVEPKPSFLSLPDAELELDTVANEEQKEEKEAEKTIDLEAQGIMVYDRTTGEESHTMWMIKPAISREITIDLPELLVESLGIGAEMLANYLTLLTDVGMKDPARHPPPLPVLCRICERQITPWWFEKHTELCAQDHRADMEVQMAQDSLNEQRSALVKVLDALEAQHRAARALPTEPDSLVAAPMAEYKGLPIGTNPPPASTPSSGRASPATHSGRSRESSSSGLSHRRSRSFAVRRPLARIVELVLDLCDTAMEISTPSVKDSRSCAPGEIRTQSPQSENHIQQVLGWQSPNTGTLETEKGLALLCNDTAQMAKAKCESVFRHRRILEYSERIRIEYEVLVSECIEAAIQKAERIKAGDLSDSGDDSGTSEPFEDGVTPQQDHSQGLLEQSTGEEAVPNDPPRSTNSPGAMAMALRNASDLSLARRTSSAGSSRTSSPHGTKTPKSHAAPSESYIFNKRNSIVMLESDTGADSDTSMHSSVTSGGRRRANSPGAELSLSRVASTRSRERKRQSLVLPSLANTARHPSPGRGPPAPSSPLRMAKPRIPSAADSIPSPLMSPTLSHSEFNSPVIRAQNSHHHRRQSSAAISEAMGRPGSPRLSAVASNPQPRAVQTSIKDFEIIKPISKGAFGSVYLSKKKSTGDYFAIKVLKKADMVAKNQVTNVKAERAIMMWQGESDFVAKLYWTFSSKDYLYLVMEYLNGGDCASLIKALGDLPEDWTKKYIGEVVQCVQHLHSRQIVHRDLKPDNLLIDAQGHLKLTDFGLSRMGLIGRQKRAINAKAEDAPPDLLRVGPFVRRAPSIASSRSTSFDFQGHHSPAHTPSMTPAYINDFNQPSYFNLTRESSSSREMSRRTSGVRSDSGDSDGINAMFRRISIAEGRSPIEEEAGSDEGGYSPDPYALQHVLSNSHAGVPRNDTPPQSSHMPPPVMALFDPEDSNRRFVGTPDYLAPETINGAGQDEMSDWWSLGCILFECLYGRPPFNADSAEAVFSNILARNIQWPGDDEDEVSEEAKDLVNRLMCMDPKERLGANVDEKYANGGEEIKAHPWFAGINWDTLREDEASFIPASENPEDTEYFDARGATMQNFAAEFDDQVSSPAQTPGADYPERPHDALSRQRSQFNNTTKRNLMPLHIPPHVRDGRSRRLSEPVVADDFGNFQYKNLPVLEKANKDVIQKLRNAQAKSATGPATSSSAGPSPSTGPSLESSPVLPMPLKRTLSTNRGNRPQSPSLLSQAESSPSRGSHPSSPLLVSFSAGQHHERRKTSSGSSSLSHTTSHPASLQPGSFFEPPSRAGTAPTTHSHTPSPSPAKSSKSGSVQLPYPSEKIGSSQREASASSPRQRSHTVGSQEGDLVPDLMPAHHKRRSGVFDVSPSSSDNEETKHALLRVQRRRASSRRLSQVSLGDVPNFRTLDVLVCEDHPVSRLVMERLLEKMRCRTISVTNGSDAIRYAMSEVKFDIILMECKLPNTSGADVARMIRDTKNANTHTPLVAVTGYLKDLGSGSSHFDALVEKPPTKEKLEEVIGRLCKWKPPSEGWKPSSLPQQIPQSSLRQGTIPADDSPSTTASSGFNFGPAMSSSYGVSSRGDSIGSSQLSSLGDGEGMYDSIPVIISRQATNEWDQSDLERNFGGLGISNSVTAEPRVDKNMNAAPPLEHQASAPAALGADIPAPRRKPSQEAIEAKRRSIEKDRHESAAESGNAGDDEDEELGHVHVRSRSPKRSAKRASKLGTEMIRVNSRGSVIDSDDVMPSKDLEMPTTDPIAEESAKEVEAAGKLTPPEFFAHRPGNHMESFDMDEGLDPHATPRQQHGHEPDPDPTPRASTSPSHTD